MKTIKKAAALLLLFTLTAGGWFYRAGDGSAAPVEQVVHTNSTQSAPATVLLQPQPASAAEHATTELCKVTTPELQLQQLMASQHQLRQQLQADLATMAPWQLHWLSQQYQLDMADFYPKATEQLKPEADIASVGRELSSLQPLLHNLKTQRFEDIRQQLETGQIAKDATIYQQLLIDWILQLQPDITESALRLLLDAQLQVNFNSLSSATIAGVTPATLTLLLSQLPQADIDKIWDSAGQKTSLAILAVQLNKPDLALFWSQQGSPLFDPKQGLDAVQAIQWQRLTPAETSAFLKLLSSVYQLPIPVSTAHYQWLQQWLPAKQHYFSDSGAQPDRLPPELMMRVAPLMQQLQQQVQTTTQLAACFGSIAKKLQYHQAAARGQFQQLTLQLLYRDSEPESTIEAELQAIIAAKHWPQLFAQLAPLTPTAAYEGIYQLVYHLLLENQADFHVLQQFVDLFNTPPTYMLFAATSNGNNKLVQLLLQRGIDINATNQHGETAIQLAAFSAHRLGNPTLEFLLAAGSNPLAGRAPDAVAIVLSRAQHRDINVTKQYISLFRHYGVSHFDPYRALIENHPQLSPAQKQAILSEM